MSRNSSGVYTLPVAAFVAGTVIKSADMNTDLSDIATALTQSLATTGVSSMTGPLKLSDGTQPAPSLTLASDTTTGWYSSGTGQWTFVSLGIAVWAMNSTTLTTSLNATFSGTVTITGTLVFTGSLTLTTVSANNYTYFTTSASATAPSSSGIKFYYKDTGVNGAHLYGVDNSSNVAGYTFSGGQCRLVLNGSSQLELKPYNGNLLTINGIPREVTADPVNYTANPVLAASNTAATFVYIYAYMSAPQVMALEMSTTGPAATPAGPSLGVLYKTGDSTRTLVGAAYTDTGGAWADTAGKLWVISYFNRKIKKSRYTSSTGIGVVTGATVSTSLEVTASFRNQFITWDDEIVKYTINMSWFTSVASGATYLYPRIDNGAVSAYSTDTGPSIISLSGAWLPTTIVAEVSNVSTGAVHYFSPTYISSAQNINVQVSQAISGAGTNVFYTLVEVRG